MNDDADKSAEDHKDFMLYPAREQGEDRPRIEFLQEYFRVPLNGGGSVSIIGHTGGDMPTEARLLLQAARTLPEGPAAQVIAFLRGFTGGTSKAEGTLHAVPPDNEVITAPPRNPVVAPWWPRNLLDPLGWIRFFVPSAGRDVLDLVREDLLDDQAEMLGDGRSHWLVLGVIWWRSATEAAPFFWRGVRRLLPLKKLGLEDSETPSQRPSADDP